MQAFHFRVVVFPFISTIRVGFGTQLMETTKQSPTINISVSQDLWKVGGQTSSLQTECSKCGYRSKWRESSHRCISACFQTCKCPYHQAMYASLRATCEPLYQLYQYVAQFPAPVDIGCCCFWKTGHYSTSIEFVATDSQKVLQVGLVSKFRPLGLGIGHAGHQRIRPIVLYPATLLESGGKISSLTKLYKTLTEGYQFLWLYIKVENKSVVSQSQQHLTRYEERPRGMQEKSPLHRVKFSG